MLYRRVILLTSCLLISNAFAGSHEGDKKTVLPVPEENPWVFALSTPGWLAGISGDVGIGQSMSYVKVSPKKVIQSYDMALSFRGEVSKGPFGIMTDFMYLSLSDGVGTKTVVNKVDFRMDQTYGQLAARWRILEGPRGSLDLYGGARYMSLYQKLTFQPNQERINEKSAELVDQIGQDLGTAVGESGLREQVAEILRPEFAPLGGRVSTLPVAPLGGGLRGEIARRVAAIIAERKDELVAALAQLKQAATAELKAKAQNKVDEIKKDLTRKIAHTLETKIDRSASLNCWWIDPFVGLRGRWNLNQAWYLTARGDVGGFGVGSKFSWEVEGALGCQITRSMFAEAGYRALGVDFQNNGITNNTITHGAQITLGLNF